VVLRHCAAGIPRGEALQGLEAVTGPVREGEPYLGLEGVIAPEDRARRGDLLRVQQLGPAG
jgi:hypothetical protein